METVNSEIEAIASLLAQAKQGQKTAESLNARAMERIRQLQARLKAGETTGDKVKDFVIVCRGIDEQQFRELLQGIETLLRQHQGEFLAEIYKHEEFHGCTGFGHEPEPREYHLDETISLAVNNGDSLVLDLEREAYHFSTNGHAICYDPIREDIKLYPTPLSRHVSYFDLLNKKIEYKNPFTATMKSLNGEVDFGLEILIGDAEVRAWFEKQRGEHYLVVFQKMAKLLGRPMAESPELAAELQRRRQVVAELLVGLIQKRDSIKKKIAGIFKATESGVYSPDGASITVCETEDDARVISMGPRQELEEIEGKIKEQLKLALELGMADSQLPTPSVQQLCQDYGINA